VVVLALFCWYFFEIALRHTKTLKSFEPVSVLWIVLLTKFVAIARIHTLPRFILYFANQACLVGYDNVVMVVGSLLCWSLSMLCVCSKKCAMGHCCPLNIARTHAC